MKKPRPYKHQRVSFDNTSTFFWLNYSGGALASYCARDLEKLRDYLTKVLDWIEYRGEGSFQTKPKFPSRPKSRKGAK